MQEKQTAPTHRADAARHRLALGDAAIDRRKCPSVDKSAASAEVCEVESQSNEAVAWS